MSTREVELSGGAPWGFRMHGGADQNQPLRISRKSSLNQSRNPRDGHRSRGRPKRRWRDDLSAFQLDWQVHAHDREEWRRKEEEGEVFLPEGSMLKFCSPAARRREPNPVNPGRKASLSGVREGDVISSINGRSTCAMSNADAHAMLRAAGPVLRLGLNENCLKAVTTPNCGLPTPNPNPTMATR
ncbi:hypothetical protein MSG28_002830 [Choristoneura fumiferana]|uniref:Uncharacterized protein n=1 Tax=Choristoneura fumiferana TaxID=7141 RepID=A0ACC0JJC2_CHOFU|nr:hypothetical protein MSG28_002830 [Choristoneura fumiferana]